jgi:TorA maturation chaperone TorD
MFDSPTTLAQARNHAYGLCGRLFLEGLTVTLLPYLRAIPELADVLPASFDADEAAAAHHTLFAYHLFPYGSIFLDDNALLGGEITSRAAQLYRQAGFDADLSAGAPDHIGHELAFLSYLLAAEVRSRQSGSLPEQRWRTAQLQFLESALLPWLVPLVIAIEQTRDTFYSQVAHLALELAADHYAGLATREQLQAELPQVARQRENVLENPRTGLREITRHLLTPHQTGLYLGRNDVRRLARFFNLPPGFGSREQMLLNLLRAAAQYDQSYQLWQQIGAICGEWQGAYVRVRRDFPTLAAFVVPWQARLDDTQRLLHQVASAVNELPHGLDA